MKLSAATVSRWAISPSIRARSSAGFWLAHHFTADTPAHTTSAKCRPSIPPMLDEL